AAATGLLITTWIGSAWFSWMWWPGGRYLVRVDSGSVTFFRVHETSHIRPADIVRPGTFVHAFFFALRPWCRTGPAVADVGVPMWILILPLAGATTTAWRLDTLARRRALLNLCPKC